MTSREALVEEGAAKLREYSIESCERSIRGKNAEIKAVLTVLDEPLRASDAPADSVLGGVPFVLKDVWDTAGIRTTGGSYRHRARVPDVSSHCAEAFLRAGAVLLGKSNLSDLAFSAESDNHILGPVRNPLDLTRTAGGSTGGAAAVATGMGAFDWGSDFGGSIRCPAAFCGIVGMRLSNAAWPVEADHFPLTSKDFWPFCGMGPLAKSVAECAAVIEGVRDALNTRKKSFSASTREVVLYGPDAKHRGAWSSFESDATAILSRIDVQADTGHGLRSPVKVNELFDAYLCSHLEEFASGGEVGILESVPYVLGGLATLGKIDKRMHPNTAVLFALIALGRVTLYRDKDRWKNELEAFRESVMRIFSSGRLIVSPTTTLLPPKHGRAAFAYGLQTFTKFGNMTDLTSLAMPFGTFEDSKLPRSLLINGPPGSEDAVLALATRLEAEIAA